MKTNSNLPIDEALYEEGYNQAIRDLDNCDWSAFRREVAKDILCEMVSGGYSKGREEAQASLAVDYADELIKQLKEK